MGKNSTPAPTPDPLIGQAAQSNAALGQQQLDFAKQQYAAGQARQDNYDQMIGKVVDSQLGSQDKSNQWAQQDRDLGQLGKGQFDDLANKASSTGDKYGGWLGDVANQFGADAQNQYKQAAQQQDRYNSTFVPVENKIASDAMGWDSAARQDAMAAQAKGDAVTAGQQANDAANRQMMSMGVNPNSGKFAATSRANDIATQLAAAGAGDMARNNVRMQGVQLRQQAGQLGQQVLGSANNATSLGMQATSAQQNATQASNGAITAGITQAGQLKASGLGAAGVGYQGLASGLTAGNSAVGNQGAGMTSFNAGNQALMNGMNSAASTTASGAGIANNLYNSQIGGYQAQNQANGAMMSGVGSLVGTGAALYL